MKRISLPLLLALICGGPTHAEQILIPIGQQDTSDLKLPQRGQSKASVRESYGLPLREYPAVGQPPITRWDYAIFSVYFEYDHVVDAVVHHRPVTPADIPKP